MTRQIDIQRRPWQAFACFATFGFFWGSWAALIPAIKARTDASEGELGIVLLVLVAAALPSMLSSGSIVDRFGDRALAPITAFFAAAILLPGFARSPLTLGLSVIALGVASGAMDLAMNASVAIEEQRSNKRLMHGAHATFSAGLVAGSILGGVMRAAGVSPPAILTVVAALLASTAVGIHISLRGRFEEGRPSLQAEGQAGRLRLSRPLLILGGLCGLAFVLESSMESWSALHLEQTLGAGPGVGGLGPAFFGAAAATGRLGAQGFAARIPDRPLVAVATLVAAAGTVVTAIAPSAGDHANFENFIVRYPPQNVSALAPVGYSGFRWASQLDPIWNAYVLGCIISIAPAIEAARVPKDSGIVFSYRFAPDSPSGDLFDRNYSWPQFIERSLKLSEESNFVVSCDIADFYARLSHHRLENALQHLSGTDDIRIRLMRFLSNFSNTSRPDR